jgi:hypothetical protein
MRFQDRLMYDIGNDVVKDALSLLRLAIMTSERGSRNELITRDFIVRLPDFFSPGLPKVEGSSSIVSSDAVEDVISPRHTLG